MSVDRFLQAYVKLANQLDEPVISVTLNVGGALVSGEIVGTNTYLKFFRAEVSSEPTEEAVEAFEGLFRDSTSGDEDLYINLCNARVYLSESIGVPTEGVVLWRGRLDAVDGFFFGLLGS